MNPYHQHPHGYPGGQPPAQQQQQPNPYGPPLTLPPISTYQNPVTHHAQHPAYSQPSPLYRQPPPAQIHHYVSQPQPQQYLPSDPSQPPGPYPAYPVAVGQTPVLPPQQSAQPSLSRSDPRGNGRYRFQLEVAQQPIRARMCGFGDKDRRPITPPPCVRLVIFDLRTGQEVHADKVDGSFFILQVDLWNDAADRESNVVRSNGGSSGLGPPLGNSQGSISAAETTSFPPTQPVNRMAQMQQAYYFQHLANLPQQQRPMFNVPPQLPESSPNNNLYTRNLIGSLTVNASKLTDDSGKDSWWFVLQDLSVRTEGRFRLRMNFIDLGQPARDSVSNGNGKGNGAAANGKSGPMELNKTQARVLAHEFSDVFQVFSAKKFPGVIESTELSKKFAAQGIKIPIRKDGREDGGRGGKEEDVDEDEADD